MLILPAIDIRDGKCVRLAQGDYGREKVYDQDPVGVAARFESQGARWLHVVDLDGARAGSPPNLGIVERIAKTTSLKIEFGGGVRSLAIARRALELGVSRVVIGTKLVQDPELSRQLFAELGEAAVGGIDARSGQVATEGWTASSGFGASELARAAEAMGCRRLILTDIAQDGMLTGPNLGLLREVGRAVGIPIIQSGGISGPADLAALRDLGAEAPEGVIVGRAIYEGRLDLAAVLREFGGRPTA